MIKKYLTREVASELGLDLDVSSVILQISETILTNFQTYGIIKTGVDVIDHINVKVMF